MNALDWVILLGTMMGIAGYGVWRTRHVRSLNTYFKGSHSTGWWTIGLSVMATQASAITFLSIPGQGFESGVGFVQNYFGLPLALIIVSAVFLPLYRRLGVFTAYEFLGRRFDAKTRLLSAGLFLVLRGLSAGVTIYAPAIILSSVLGWRLDLTILCTGLVVVVYTVTGGSAAVNLTQTWQMAVIFGGMVTAFIVALMKLPAHLGVGGAVHLAGAMGKMEAVSFSLDPNRRYTFWTGMLGGTFLMLSYFGTDQSQVQRYLGGAALREGRLGLMFNALVKIPMQFFILLLGVLVFVFYQFEKPPLFFNQAEWRQQERGANAKKFWQLDGEYAAAYADKQAKIHAWLAARAASNPAVERTARAAMTAAQGRVEAVRAEARAALVKANPRVNVKDSDYVFITFILQALPHGVIGLLVAVMMAATFGSKASELNALGATATIDLWRHFRPLAVPDEARNLRVAKRFTAFWGLFAIGFALFIGLAENLIEAINKLSSVFSGSVLGLFFVAFFFKRVGGTAVFWAAVAAQTLVFILYFTLPISYLWHNLIGCAACVGFSVALQIVLDKTARPAAPSPGL